MNISLVGNALEPGGHLQTPLALLQGENLILRGFKSFQGMT